MIMIVWVFSWVLQLSYAAMWYAVAAMASIAFTVISTMIQIYAQTLIAIGIGIIGAEKTWKKAITAFWGDGRLCFRCYMLDENTVSIYRPWFVIGYGPTWKPPLHKNCRCHYTIQAGGGHGPEIPIYW